MQSRVEAKEAARVTVNLTMTLAEARQVQWQGGGPQGLMGELLDKKELKPKDLTWAIQSAYNPAVRSAALTLLAHWLGEGTTLQSALRYGPQVIEGSSYLEDKELDSVFNVFQYFYIGTIVVVAFGMWLLSSVIDQIAKGNRWDITIVAGLIVLLGAAAIASPFAWLYKRRLDNEVLELRNWRAGQEGEAWIEDLLRARLDSRWSIFRNIELPDLNRDIDFILASTSGVWVLEAKAHKSILRMNHGTWERKTRNRWETLTPNPSGQAVGNAVELRKYLKGHNVELGLVKAVVILTQDQYENNFDRTSTPKPTDAAIWLRDEVEEKLYELNASGSYLPQADYERIVAMLKEVAQANREKDKEAKR